MFFSKLWSISVFFSLLSLVVSTSAAYCQPRLVWEMTYYAFSA